MAEEMKMISQSLLTEEGFLNVNAVKELENEILNTPPVYERAKDDPEWSVKRWTFNKEIVGSFAKYAVQASPYACPEGLEFVCNFLSIELDKVFDFNTAGMAEISLCEINKALYDILYEKGIEPFDNWNKCKAGNTPDIVYTSRFDGKPNPDNDFIDLDALLRNVCLDIRMERRASDLFDAKFKEEHPEC